MKKIFFLFILIGGAFYSSQGQGLYLNLAYGQGLYGFNDAPALEDANITVATNNIMNVQGNLGKGFAPFIGAGYFFNKYIGAELNVGYIKGNASTIFFSGEDRPYYEASDQYTCAFLNPAVVLRLKNKSKFLPYAKLGLILGFSNQLDGTRIGVYEKNSFNSSEDFNATIKYRGGLAAGFRGVVGADFMISNKLAFFAELALRLAHWTPANNESSFIDGNGNTNINGNAIGMASTVNLNALGLDIGLRYYFKNQ